MWRERALFVDPTTCVAYDFESWAEGWEDAVNIAREAALEIALESGDEKSFDQILQKGSDELIGSRFVSLGSGIRVRVPEIIVCTEYKGLAFKKTKHRPKFSRTNIYRRDKNICAYCGHKFETEDLNLEHIIPRAQGGETDWMNITLACIPCNSRKRDRTPSQAGMRLLRDPFIPKAEDVALLPHERLKRRVGRNTPKTWGQFMGKLYWEVELQS